MTPTPTGAAVPAQPDALSYEQVCDILETGNPTDEECRLIRLGYDAAQVATLTAQGAAERAVPAAGPDVKYALAHADTAADLLMRAHEQAPETWRGWYDDALVHIDIARKALSAVPATPAPQPADPDGEAFRTAACLGLTLRFYGGCAQSSIPGTPSAYEVVTGADRAAAMREAVQRAGAVIASGGEAQRLEAQPAPAQDGRQCDTPNYCGSVQRCTAMDADRAARAAPQPATADALTLGLLEELVAYDSYQTEYDGRMYSICPDCGGQDDEHRDECAFVRARAHIAALATQKDKP